MHDCVRLLLLFSTLFLFANSLIINQVAPLVINATSYDNDNITIVGNNFPLTLSYSNITNCTFSIYGQTTVDFHSNTIVNSNVAFYSIGSLSNYHNVFSGQSKIIQNNIPILVDIHDNEIIYCYDPYGNTTMLPPNSTVIGNVTVDIPQYIVIDSRQSIAQTYRFNRNSFVSCHFRQPLIHYYTSISNGIVHEMKNNSVDVILPYDSYGYSSIYNSSTNLELLDQYIWSQNITGATTKIVFLLDFNDTNGGSVVVHGNIYTERFQSITPLSTDFDPVSIFAMDTFIRLNGFGNMATVQIEENTIQAQNNYNLSANIRTGVSISNVAAVDHLRLLGGSLSKHYQYIAKAYRMLNPSLESYQNSIEIKPHPSDEFNRWGGHLCHYACKKNCDVCILTANNTGSREFSPMRDGVCYGYSRHESIDTAGRNCGHYYMLLTENYTNIDTAIITSQNRINGTTLWKPRSIPLNGISNVQIEMSKSLLVSPGYASVYRPSMPNTDPFFYNYHPFIILGRDGDVVTNSIIFEDINFVYTFDGNMNTNVFFTNVIHQTVVSPPNLILKFNRCMIRGNNVQPTPIPGQSGGFSFLESYASIIIYPVGYTATCIITDLDINNGNVFDIGKLFKGVPYYNNLLINNMYFRQMTNGWMRVNVGEVKMNLLTCIDCLPDVFDYHILTVNGTNADSTSYLTNFNFNSSSFTDGTGLTNVFRVENFNSIVMEYLTSNPAASTGIYFEDLVNLPCTKLSLSLVKNASPYSQGIVSDVRCIYPPLACSGSSCVATLDTIPPFCMVDKSFSIFSLYYRNQYFHTVQDAIDNCHALNSMNERWIYIVGNTLYVENELNIYGVNGTEKLILQAINGTVVIVGSTHMISRRVDATYFKFNMSGIEFFNPRGVAVYTSSIDPHFLKTGAFPIDGVEIDNCSFVGIKPLIPISVPTTYSGWNSFKNNLLTRGSIHPYIREPNVVDALYLNTIENAIITNVKIYGSVGIGIREYKGITIIGYNTTITNVQSENLWGGFLDITGAGGKLSVTQNKCKYYCGGFSVFSPSGVVHLAPKSSGTIFEYIGNDLIDEQPTIVNNTYTPSIRFPYGNPFVDNSNTNLGYLTGVIIENVIGTTWKYVRYRSSPISGYPVGFRVINCDRIAWAQNDVGAVMYYDSRILLREIQRSNDLSLTITGFLWHGRFGPLTSDSSQNPDLFCNGLCPLTNTALQCKIGANLTATLTDYNSGNAALEFCEFNKFLFIDPVWVENLNFTLANKRNAYPTPILEITALSTTTIYGKHTFDINCPGAGPTYLPTGIRFSNLNLQYAPNATGDSILRFTASSSCKLSTITIQNTKFTLKPAIGTVGYATGIICDGCASDLMTINSGTTISAPGANYPWIGLYYNPSGSAMNKIVFTNNHVNNGAMGAVVTNNAKGFTITSNILVCNGGTGESCILVDGSSMVLYDNTINLNTITEVQSVGATYAGIRWNLNQNFPSLDSVLTTATNILGNIGSGSPLGLVVTFYNWNDYIPCQNGSYVYIQALSLANPKLKGFAHDVVFSDPTLSTLALSPAQASCGLCSNGCKQEAVPDPMINTLYIGFSTGLAIGLIVLFCCGGIKRFLDCRRFVPRVILRR